MSSSIFFPDETADLDHVWLALRSPSRVDSIADQYLSRCQDNITTLIQALPPSLQTHFNNFRSLDDLLCLKNAAARATIAVIVQLALLLRYIEQDPDLLGRQEHLSVVGHGIGAVPAAALACAVSITDLLCKSHELTLLSVRLGLAAVIRACTVDRSQNEHSWALRLKGIDSTSLSNILNEFSSKTASLGRPYLSSIFSQGAILSGAPERLATFVRSLPADIQESQEILPVYSPYNARHLPMPDVDAILGSSALLDARVREFVDISIPGTSICNQRSRSLRNILAHAIRSHFSEKQDLRHFDDDFKRRYLNITQTHSLFQLANLGDVLNAKYEPMPHHVSPERSDCFQETDIAIIGMAGKFPGADCVEELWQLLIRKESNCEQVPPSRFDIHSHLDSTGSIRNKTAARWGHFLQDPGNFDHAFFRMSPREAAQTDPMQRLILTTTYEALESSGYNTRQYSRKRVGTFYGQTSDDWREVNASQDIGSFFITGGIRAFGPGRLNHFFGWDGPSQSIDTACSSSAAALQSAVESLQMGTCDVAVVGGANIMTNPDLYAGLSKAHFLSPTGACKTFSQSADGYCRGEAVVTLVLKPIKHAQADKDKILAVIKGTSTCHAGGATSITHPHAASQVRLFSDCLKKSRLSAENISHVEMHGTGTQAGDAAESASVTETFLKSSRTSPFSVGALKANIGHAEAASGISSIIKAILMLQKNIIPPQPDLQGELNSRLPTQFAARIPFAQKPFIGSTSFSNCSRHILVNNFNAAGGCTAMIISDGPRTPLHKTPVEQKNWVVTVSAHSRVSFRRNLEALRVFIVDSSEFLRLSDLSYTTTARRLHHKHRRAFVVSSREELLAAMESELASSPAALVMRKPNTVCYLFGGQGNQVSFLAPDLYAKSSTFRKSVQQLSDMCVSMGFPSVRDVFDLTEAPGKDYSPLKDQLAIAVLELSLYSLWASFGLRADIVIGHSLGEFCALCIAGAMSAVDTLLLIGKRAELLLDLKSSKTHDMLAISADHMLVRQHLFEEIKTAKCEIACYNGPASTVISGQIDGLRASASKLDALGICSKFLDLPWAFHSAQMDFILAEYQVIAENIAYQPLLLPVASTVTGGILDCGSIIHPSHMVGQTRNAVRFEQALRSAVDAHFVGPSSTYIEVGNGITMSKLARKITSMTEASYLSCYRQTSANMQQLISSLCQAHEDGHDIDWIAYHREVESDAQLIDLPRYQFEPTSHWIQYEGDWMVHKNKSKYHSISTSRLNLSGSIAGISSESSEQKEEVVFLIDTNEPRTREMFHGHSVNGQALCPSSLIADIAQTGAHNFSVLSGDIDLTSSFEMRHLEIQKPLLLPPEGSRDPVRCLIRKLPSDFYKMQLITGDNRNPAVHATCEVCQVQPEQLLQEWRQSAHLVLSRANVLTHGESSEVEKMHTTTVYRLFCRMVDYSKPFRGMKQVWLHTKAFEAAAHVKCDVDNEGSHSYGAYPPLLDALLHISGFALNCSSMTADEHVYISHGWKSLRIREKLRPGVTYLVYTLMSQENVGHAFSGDVWVFNSNKEPVARCEGVRFRRITQKVLHQLLPDSTSSRVHRSPATVDRAPHTKAADNGAIDAVVDIVARDTGVARHLLDDYTMLSDIGVDSLLSFTIASSLSQIGAQTVTSQMVLEARDLKSLRHLVKDDTSSSRQMHVIKGYQTPTDTEDSESSFPERLVNGHNSQSAASQFVEAVRQIIADETGHSSGSITLDTSFSDLGVDSLVSLAALPKIQSYAPAVLPAGFLLEHGTLREILRSVSNSHSSASSVATESYGSDISRPNRLTSRVSKLSALADDATRKAIFLLPDGSGSASSYLALAKAIHGVNVFALSYPPGLSDPTCNVSINQLIHSFYDAILEIMPEGPYCLGGWSVGGSFAYEVARLFLGEGKVIQRLILIDAPCFNLTPSMQLEDLQTLSSLGHIPSSSQIYDVFKASIRMTADYKPQPLENLAQKLVGCTALWASLGASENGAAPQKTSVPPSSSFIQDPTQWILCSRPPNFGQMNGWESLLTSVPISHRVVIGDHFSVMKTKTVEDVAKIIQDVLVET